MLKIDIPEREFYDEKTERFGKIKATRLYLEHSLISISKWESKWHKPYLSKNPKTREEAIDFFKDCIASTAFA